MIESKIKYVSFAIGLTILAAGAAGDPVCAQSAPHPLAPPATDSPRDTLFGFLGEMARAFRLANSGDGDSSIALERAVRSLDLSQLPPRLAEDQSIVAAFKLKEVLDRIDLPVPAAVPGADDLAVEPAGDTGEPSRWRIPNTEIAIGRVREGERAGEYLFTPETVARVADFYDRTRHLPYTDAATPGIYDAYLSTPGDGLEVKWSRLLPAWSKRIIAGKTVWQWIASGLALLIAAALIRGLFVAASHIDRPRQAEGPSTDVRRRYKPATTVAIVFSLGITVFTEWFIDDVVNLTGIALESVIFTMAIAQYGFVCWLFVVIIQQSTEMLITLRGLNQNAASSQLARMFSLLVSVGLIVAVMIYAAQDFGLPAYSIITGLGIGGIAIGFGAQTLVRDVFSGVFFLLDDAFRVGEYVDIDGTVGTVDKISIRSLRLRHHLGALHVIPYGEIRKLTNNSRDWVIVKLQFTVPFDTDINKVRKLFKRVGQEMYEENPYYAENILEPFKLQGVSDVDDIGIVVRGKYMAKPGTQFLIRKEIYTRIQQVFEENGIEFARKEVRVRIPGTEGADNLDTSSKRAIAAAASQASEQPPVEK